MTRMWRGPCADLKSASTDPLWAAIHRRNGRLGISCNVALDGRSAEFFRIEKRGGDFYQFDLGRVEGGDPMFTVLHGSHEFTPLDPELIELHHAYIERQAEQIVADSRLIAQKLEAAADEFLA